MTRFRRGVGRATSAAVAVVLVALVGVLSAARPAGADDTTTSSVDETAVTTTTTAPTGSTSTSTTLAPERCDPVAPKALVVVGAAVARKDDTVTFQVVEVREGPPITGQTVVVTFVRDSRFFKVGERYLVTAALDPDAQLFVSKVRTRRGDDPRCVAKDPVFTYLANGKPIDTGVFSGLSGTRGRVLRAFLLPLAAVVGALLVLVIVKHTVLLVARLVARVARRHA